MTEENKREARRLYTDENMGTYAISKQLGLDHSSIRYWVRDLPRKPRHVRLILKAGDTKTCSVCKKEKPVEDFAWRDKESNLKHYNCRDCQVSMNRSHYLENKEKALEDSKSSKLRRRKKMWDLKATLKCSQCEEKHPACLEFHHLDPSIKENDISSLLYTKWEDVEKEIGKCIIVCSNCHRKIHHEERQKTKAQ